MKYVFIFLTFFILANCSKPKSVFVCGDHVCLNKAEAKQYFEENLSIEVKIIDKKDKKELNLIELNLENNQNNKKSISLYSKKITDKKLKILSQEEIIMIKENINKKKAAKKKSKKIKDKDIPIIKQKIAEKKKKFKQTVKNDEIANVDIKKNNIVDICTILEKCSIDEISKYILKKGKTKDFPDITIRK